ncbi:hypothetical protein Btru_059969 [Bulinus truncatus]|nr:hypothetical protein Btru_059969 [Bulinus truncatus]
MGKDDERRSSKKMTASTKEDLSEEHIQLVNKEKELNLKHQDIKAVFQKLEEAYLNSKGTFSVQRYGQLKTMIKDATSDATIQSLQQTINYATGQEAKSSVAGLLTRAKEFSGDSQEQVQSAAKPSSKSSSFFKKLKNLTGFSDDPIRDEDVMSEAELLRDNDRKKRSVHMISGQLSKALTKLEKLKHDYETSKSHTPPKRYQDLKDMIKTAVAEKL